MARVSLLLLAVAIGAVYSNPITAPYYKPLTQEQASRLTSWDNSNKQNIWQLSGQTQGDMILTPEQRNGLVNTWYRWGNREVPYELDPIFDEAQANQIHAALRTFAAVSCVNVRPRTPADVDYVYVTGEDSGCWSYVGRLGGAQLLNLQRNGCVWDHIIIHEFLHAIGFYHQQSSTERDDYVAIMWENITPGTAHNFDKFGPDVITNFGQPYDYYSVMHYDAFAFTYNGEPTIIPHDQSFLYIIGRTYQIRCTYY
ncbi:Astacin (Peptidase family M12A) [Popillia japonica]|uniref:Metalloendopeptidase n=1 Tax=Popillia japonica TaxID=7064 RepID=A0AAW1IC87_POPJA